MATDAYQGSGGWSGGSPLSDGQGVYGGTDSVLGSYMQTMKQYDPASGSMRTARPQQSNQQMSSLARMIQAPQDTPAKYNTQPAATPSATTPVQVTVQPQTAPAGMSLAPGRAAYAVQTPATSAGYSRGAGVDMSQAYPGDAVALPAPQVAAYGDSTIVSTYDPTTRAYRQFSQLVQGPRGYTDPSTTYTNINGVTLKGTAAVDAYMRDRQGAGTPTYAKDYNAAAAALASGGAPLAQQYNTAFGAQQQQAQSLVDVYRQKAIDDANAAAAQDAADRATAFNLGNALQAPDTSAVDAAGAADLARVISKYRAAGYGPEAASMAALGSQSAASQATVNKVNHDSAYADAFNSNYGVFADALKARRDTTIEASGQRLQYDMQGVQQAVAALSQQAQQLGAEAQVKTQAALLPLRQALQAYELAVTQYKAGSDQARKAASAVLSLGGNLFALGTKK